jgi:hypothetical protein
MTSGSGDYEDIIRVIEVGKHNRLCLIRIFKQASDKPRPIIELDREDQQYFTYEILKEFDDIQQAHDYAQQNEIFDVEY